MTPLLLKDLRLSLDAIRPWVIVLIGFGIAAGIAIQLPAPTIPLGLRGVSATELIGTVGGIAGIASVATAAWIAATVAHGDRRHGARSLAVVLPIERRGMVLSKLLAIGVGILCVSLVAIALRSVAGAPSVPGRSVPGFEPAVVLASAVVGAAFALAVAALARGVFATVMISLLGTMVAGMAGYLGGAAILPFVADEHIRLARIVNELHEVEAMSARVLAASAAAGVVAAALVAGCIGCLAVARPLTTARSLQGTVLALVLAFISGTMWAPMALRHDEVHSWKAYQDRAFHFATDDEIVDAIGRIGTVIASASTDEMYMNSMSTYGPFGILITSDDWRRVEIGLERLKAIPFADRPASPLRRALRNVERYGTWVQGILSLRLIPPDEPEALSKAAEVALAFPAVPNIRRVLDFPVARAGGWTNQQNPRPEIDVPRGHGAELDAALRQRLRTLVTLERYATMREPLQKVIDLIDEQAAAPPPAASGG
jgi:hypothetical protein